YERGDSSWVNRDPEVGRYVFTERYYGVQEIRESGPRPIFTEATTVAIAKSPNTMSGEATYEYRLEFSDDRVRVIREVSDETRITTLRRLE
ncbi:MAG: hypothetical protein JRH17_25510, partial [Deltaproteobacteria bacterium]|nr:hypothetical protein [Deltaproteobacteria bacterium]